MEIPIATKRNTYAKRQREQDKKRRAEEKRARREQAKNAPPSTSVPMDPREDVVPEQPAT